MYKKLTFLGTGTSSGIPTIGCNCEVCQSTNPRNKRLRSSIFVETEDAKIIFDLTPDFRQQMLEYNKTELDAVFFTHQHFDHIGGFDDIRAFNYKYRKSIPIFGLGSTIESIKKSFYYAFQPVEQLGGGIPLVDIKIIDDFIPILINKTEIIPIPLLHGKMNILGYRIGDMAYCTDTNNIPKDSYSLLENLDILIIDALRYNPHETHFTVEKAVDEVERIRPRKAYLIHMAHQIDHEYCQSLLPNNVYLSYDGLSLEF